MIPKVIHYCWFGGNKKPLLAEKCIQSWKQFLPDYEIIEWNESNFDLSVNEYAKEAYEAKKYAFVTDYVRLFVLDHYGGIYMDTDVQVLKSIDSFLKYPAFTGFESEKDIPTGIMASKKDGIWVKECLKYYTDRHFLKADGTYDLTTNVESISAMMQANGFLLNNQYQVYKEEMHIFPKDYFCPKDRSGRIKLTKNSYCIHHFNGSWMPPSLKFKKFFFRKIVGPVLTEKLINFKRKFKPKKK